MSRIPLRLDYARGAEYVARSLLGQTLAVLCGETWRSGVIVETEAYLGPHDRACHSYKGRSPRRASLFGPAGRAYVYIIYGMYPLFNVVTGEGAAVLLRAADIDGEHGRSGPARLARALRISRHYDGLRLDTSPLALFKGPGSGQSAIASGPRINIESSGKYWSQRRLRFWLKGHPAVSRPDARFG